MVKIVKFYQLKPGSIILNILAGNRKKVYFCAELALLTKV